MSPCIEPHGAVRARNWVARASVSLTMVLLAVQSHAQRDEPLTIEVDAESSSLDRNGGTFEGLRISVEQENLVIEADQATVAGLEAERGRWQLSGNVRVMLDRVVMTADRATFTFGDETLISGELAGSPATFEGQPVDGSEAVTGSADRVSYNNLEGIIRLEGRVALTAGPNRVTGCDVIYDLGAERVSSGRSDCGEPFRVTIIPPAEDTSRSDPPIDP